MLVGEGQSQIVAVLVAGFDNVIGIQFGSGGIDMQGELCQDLLAGTLIANRTGNGQIYGGTICQRLAIGIGEVVQIVIEPGIDEGNHAAITGNIHGLGFLLHQFVMEHVSGFIGIDEAQFFRITHQRNVEFGELIQGAVVVGGNNVVIGGIDHMAVLIDLDALVGVQTQDPVGAGDVGPQNVVVFVGKLICHNVFISGCPEAILIPEAIIEEGRCIPATVEAQERQAQRVFTLALQVNKTFHIVAAGEIGIDPLLVRIGQINGDGDSCSAACSHGNRVLIKRDSAVIQSTVGLGQEVQAGICFISDIVFTQQAGRQCISLCRITVVMNSEGEGILAVLAVTQLRLGAITGGNGQIGTGSDGSLNINQAGALLTGRCFQTGSIVNDRHSSAHQQAVDHGAQLITGGSGHFSPQILQQQCGHTGNLRCCHGSTGHNAVLAVIVAGVDVTAHTGHIGQQTQIGRNTPTGEGADLTAMAVSTKAGSIRHIHLLVSSVCHLLTILQGDQRNGNGGINLVALFIGDAGEQTEGEDIFRNIVPNQHANRACILGIEGLVAKGGGTTANHGNLAFDDAIAVFIIEIGLFAQARHNDVLYGVTGQDLQVVVQVAIVVLYALHVEDSGAVRQGKVRSVNFHIVHTGDGQNVHISGRRRNGCIIDVLGGLHVRTVGRTIGAGGFVTGSNFNDHVGLTDAFKNTVDLFQFGGGEACGATQRHIDHVNTQDHAVFQRCNDVIHVGAAGLAIEDLHGDDLGIGSHTHNTGTVYRVCRSNTGNVGAMVANAVIVGNIGVAHGIVKGKRNLCIIVKLFTGQRAVEQRFTVQIMVIQ